MYCYCVSKVNEGEGSSKKNMARIGGSDTRNFLSAFYVQTVRYIKKDIFNLLSLQFQLSHLLNKMIRIVY